MARAGPGPPVRRKSQARAEPSTPVTVGRERKVGRLSPGSLSGAVQRVGVGVPGPHPFHALRTAGVARARTPTTASRARSGGWQHPALGTFPQHRSAPRGGSLHVAKGAGPASPSYGGRAGPRARRGPAPGRTPRRPGAAGDAAVQFFQRSSHEGMFAPGQVTQHGWRGQRPPSAGRNSDGVGPRALCRAIRLSGAAASASPVDSRDP